MNHKREISMHRHLAILALFFFLINAPLAMAQTPIFSDPPGRDSILDWNATALACVATDFSNTFGSPDQVGPVRTSRALAIVHLAMFDAANSITPKATPYLIANTPSTEKNVSLDAAVAQAAADTLTSLYPKQATVISASLTEYLRPIANATARNNGIRIGKTVAQNILAARANDGSSFDGTYVATGEVGKHDVDPLNTNQGFCEPAWGQVTPFSPSDSFQFVPNDPPDLGSDAYATAFNDVKSLGGDGITTPTTRTQEQTEIGLFWAYDGSNKIGTPPRLYNQIARTIAVQKKNTEIQNARYFGLINAAMADAGILCWGIKYRYALWRPILGIRRADEDGNIATDADSSWIPLCAPASNGNGKRNFTPNFPSYTSGHATFGAAAFRTIQNYYATDEITFTFVSDELNGITTDTYGNVRPFRPRTFNRLSDAALENARSRIYLGIHWQFDADEGVRSGVAVGDHVFQTILQNRILQTQSSTTP